MLLLAGERAHEGATCGSLGVHVSPRAKCGAIEGLLLQVTSPQAKQKPRSVSFGDLLVAPTGVDPVTFRFSVERSTN